MTSENKPERFRLNPRAKNGKQVGTYITVGEHVRLCSAARERGQTLAELIREAIMPFIQEQPQ